MARLAEQDRVSRRDSGKGVRRRLALVVGLGLDDHTGNAVALDATADQIARHLEQSRDIDVGIN